MKKLLPLLFVITIAACDGNNDDVDNDFFECTVDFVQFVDEQNAIVRFETSLGSETNYYYGRYTYTLDGKDYTIGDDLVYITDFQTTAKGGASFRFKYGESLGPFCKQIFEDLPVHIHQNFDAEAELETLSTDKGVGRWKIRKKSNFSLD
jgi:hypothetical protein